MAALLLLARLLLAALFLVAGVAKLTDQAGSRQALIGFGVPDLLAAPLGVILPPAELAVAVALIPAASASWGAMGALALLFFFILGIGVSLARGHRPDCHCFGQLHSAPVGWPTLVRNGVLAGVAGFIVSAGPGPALGQAVSWLGDLRTAEVAGLVADVVLFALIAFGGWLVVNLLRQNGRLLVRVDALEASVGQSSSSASDMSVRGGLPVGAPAPTFRLPSLNGEVLTLGAILGDAPDKPVMLVFSDPDCGPCIALLPEIRRWQRDHGDKLTVALVTRKGAEDERKRANEQRLSPVLLQEDREVADAFEAGGTPSAVIVRPDGTIGSPVARGAEAIRRLLSQALVGALPPSAIDGQGAGLPHHAFSPP